jgi:hypothetical protein
MPPPAAKPKPKGRKKRTPETEAILQDPAVLNWFSQLSEGSKQTYSEHFPPFIIWLRKQPRFGGITPSGLLNRQFKNKRKKPTKRNQTPEYEVVDLLNRWITSLPDRYSTKLTKSATVWSFFKRNRCPLPKDSEFIIRSDKAPTLDVLTYEDIKKAISAAKLRDKSHMLVRLQGILDTDALDYANRKLGDHIVSEMRAGKELIRLDIPGRKRRKNIKAFYTFIGKDAIQCLKKYFDVERGWPAPGEPIWVNKFGRPYAKSMYGENYLKSLRLQGLIPKPNGRLDARFGRNLHEWRDTTITYLHTNAKRHGFDMAVADFIAGHSNKLDPSNYDKFMKEKWYVEEQYRIAEPHLNIESNPDGMIRSKVEELDAKLADIEKKAARGDSRETLIEAVKELRDKLALQWIVADGADLRHLKRPVREFAEVEELLEILENPKTSRLEVYKAQKRFDKLSARLKDIMGDGWL